MCLTANQAIIALFFKMLSTGIDQHPALCIFSTVVHFSTHISHFSATPRIHNATSLPANGTGSTSHQAVRIAPERGPRPMNRSSIQTMMREAGLQPPRTLTIGITGSCNLSCRHCWVEAGPRNTQSHVSRHLITNAINDQVEMGGSGIRITGGEPLCHPECGELLSYACSTTLSEVILQTNGLLMTNGILTKMLQPICDKLQLEISLDGATAETHDFVRGTGTFIRVMELLSLLDRTGLSRRTTLLFTEMSHNLADFPQVLQLAEKFNCAGVRAGTLVQGGRAGSDKSIAPPSPDQYRELARRYCRDILFRHTYNRIGTMAPLEWLKSPTPHSNCCCSFAEDAYLTAGGRLYPCRMCHSDRHSVSQSWHKGLPLALLESIPLWTELQKLKTGRRLNNRKCHDCREADICAAGCMGRALASCGNLMGVDDRCEIRRHIIGLRNSCHSPTHTILSQI